jgi:hypothetical protein
LLSSATSSKTAAKSWAKRACWDSWIAVMVVYAVTSTVAKRSIIRPNPRNNFVRVVRSRNHFIRALLLTPYVIRRLHIIQMLKEPSFSRSLIV